MASFEVDQERGDIGRVDAADPARLAERAWPDAMELLAGLGAELRDRVIVEVGRERLVLQAPEPLDLLRLAGDVAAVLRLDRDLVDDVGVGRRAPPARGRGATQVVPGRRGTAEDLEQRLAVDPWSGQERRASASIRSLRARNRSQRRSSTRPTRRPSSVRRRSALSCRSRSRYSARLVNIRYGSSTPRVTRSSIRTPM